jgi:hypothetical protein
MAGRLRRFGHPFGLLSLATDTEAPARRSFFFFEHARIVHIAVHMCLDLTAFELVFVRSFRRAGAGSGWEIVSSSSTRIDCIILQPLVVRTYNRAIQCLHTGVPR